MNEIAARLEKLERDNQRMRRTGVATLVVVAGAVLLGQAAPSTVSDEIHTRRLVLEDAAGRRRGDLRANEYGASLYLYDEAGKSHVSLSAFKDGPALDLSDEARATRVELAALKDGPFLLLQDPQGFRATLGVAALVNPSTGTTTKRSAASLVLFANDGKVLWETP